MPINLLPKSEFETSIKGRVLKWLLSSFRIIVILTEMCVMAAFLSRFWLDAQNSDLNELLKQKQTVIASFQKTESDFRLLKKRVEAIAKVESLPKNTDYLKTITLTLPPDTFLTSFTAKEKEIQTTGISGTESGLGQYLANLEGPPKFSGVELTQAGSDKENPAFTAFTVKILLK